MDIGIKPATLHDIDALIDVYNQSFYSDYQKYGMCPGYNRTRESMAHSINQNKVFKIIVDHQIVGAVCVRDDGGGAYYLGSICVIPSYENKGIGQAAMQFITSTFSDATHWSLETPSDKLRNHYFYKKHGFEITKEYLVDHVSISFFEKYCFPTPSDV